MPTDAISTSHKILPRFDENKTIKLPSTMQMARKKNCSMSGKNYAAEKDRRNLLVGLAHHMAEDTKGNR